MDRSSGGERPTQTTAVAPRREFLLALGEHLRLAREEGPLLSGVQRLLGQYLGVNRVCFARVEPDGALVVEDEWNDGTIVSSIGRHVFAEAHPDSWLRWEARPCNDVAADDAISAESKDRMLALGIRSGMDVPLIWDGRHVALLTIHQNSLRAWTGDEVSLAEETAERAWAAVERLRVDAELLRSQEALYQSEKLTALGSLLAGVSHELNNPLSILVAQAEMLEIQAGASPLADRALEIRKAAERCARIVQTFLAMARQEPPKRRTVDLNRVVQAALELTAYTLRSHGVAVETALDAAAPVISADADQLHQVIINLIVNAQQAMQDAPAPRRLRVRTRHDPAAGTVVLEVEDSGPGVPADIRRRIFEPFFTTKPQNVGTGVGLSFSLGLVQAHGGELQLAEPAGGRGALFRVVLPADPPAASAPDAPAEPSPAAAARTALVVDDEAGIARALSDYLALEGYDCEVALSGAEAISRLGGRTFDLVISDLRMPGVDGPALFDWIKTHRPELAPRTAFATGDTLGASAARFLAREQRPFIEKPFTLQTLRGLLREMGSAVR